MKRLRQFLPYVIGGLITSGGVLGAVIPLAYWGPTDAYFNPSFTKEGQMLGFVVPPFIGALVSVFLCRNRVKQSKEWIQIGISAGMAGGVPTWIGLVSWAITEAALFDYTGCVDCWGPRFLVFLAIFGGGVLAGAYIVLGIIASSIVRIAAKSIGIRENDTNA
ncbi:MAG: hypothetical protein FJ317_05135 [SAR202 cluster bacterium]|nr:hypothetical protein [SAR202 cluster bacterium]